MDILSTAFSESLTLSLMVIFMAYLLNFSRDQRLRVRQILLLFIPQDYASQLVYSVLKVCFLLATFSVTFGFFFMRFIEDLEVETSGWKVQLSNSLFSFSIFFFQFYVCFFMWSIRKRSQIVQLPYFIWRLLIFWVSRKVQSCWQAFSLKEFASLLEEARVLGRKVSFSGVGDLLQRVTLSLQKNWKLQMISISSSEVKNLLQLGPITIIEMNSSNFYDFSVPKLSLSARRVMIFCTSWLLLLLLFGLRSTLKISSRMESAMSGLISSSVASSLNSEWIFLRTRALVFLLILGDIIRSICFLYDSSSICSFSCLRFASSYSREETSVFLTIDLDLDRIFGLNKYSSGAVIVDLSLESRSKVLSLMLLLWLAVICLDILSTCGVPVIDSYSVRLISCLNCCIFISFALWKFS